MLMQDVALLCATMEDKWNELVIRQERFFKHVASPEELTAEVAYQKSLLEREHPFCDSHSTFLWGFSVEGGTGKIAVLDVAPSEFEATNGFAFVGKPCMLLRTNITARVGVRVASYLYIYPRPIPMIETKEETGLKKRKRMQIPPRDEQIFLNFARLRIIAMRSVVLLCIGFNSIRHALNGFMYKEPNWKIRFDTIESDWLIGTRNQFYLNLHGFHILAMPCVSPSFVYQRRNWKEEEDENSHEHKSRLQILQSRLNELKDLLPAAELYAQKGTEKVERDLIKEMKVNTKKFIDTKRKAKELTAKKNAKAQKSKEIRGFTKWEQMNRDTLQKFTEKISPEDIHHQLETLLPPLLP